MELGRKMDQFKQHFPLNEEMETITQDHLNKVHEKEFTETKNVTKLNKLISKMRKGIRLVHT